MTQWTEFSCIIKPSPLGGVGVFATHDIPKGAKIFSNKFSPRKTKIKNIPSDFQKYCILLNEEDCLCPERFDRMEIGWYINHSFQPNITKIAADTVIATRDIKAGEELFMDYNQLDEPEHLKEDYYKR